MNVCVRNQVLYLAFIETQVRCPRIRILLAANNELWRTTVGLLTFLTGLAESGWIHSRAIHNLTPSIDLDVAASARIIAESV